MKKKHLDKAWGVIWCWYLNKQLRWWLGLAEGDEP